MTNKTFKELCKELKKAQKVRARAIKNGNSEYEEKSNIVIDKIIAEMKQNKDFFASTTSRDISEMSDNDKQYNILMDEYEIYSDRGVAVENAYNAEVTSDSQINKILGKKDKKVAIITGGLVGVLGLSALSGVVGYKLGHKKDEDNDNGYDYTNEYTKEENVMNYNDDLDLDVQYEEKGTTTVKFKSNGAEYTNSESNTTSNTYDSSNTNNASNNRSDDNKSTDSKNNKKSKKTNTNKKTTTKNKTTNENTTKEEKIIKSEPKTETNTNTNNNNNKQDYIIPTEEIKTETVTEEPAPKVPEDMPIEEDENDVIYYDINGNETTKENADKSFEQSNTVESSTSKNENKSNNTVQTKEETTKEVKSEVKEDYTIPTTEKHNEEVIEIKTPVPEDMPIEEDLINEYKAIKAQLEETKALLEEQEQSNDNAMSLSL